MIGKGWSSVRLGQRSGQVSFNICALCLKIAREDEAKGDGAWSGEDTSKDLFAANLRPFDDEDELVSPLVGLVFVWIMGEFAKCSIYAENSAELQSEDGKSLLKLPEFNECDELENDDEVWLSGGQKWRSELAKFCWEGRGDNEWVVAGGTKYPRFM